MDIKEIYEIIKQHASDKYTGLTERSFRVKGCIGESGEVTADGIPILGRRPVSKSDSNIKIGSDYVNIISDEKSGYLAHNILREFNPEMPESEKEALQEKYKEFDRSNNIATVRSELMELNAMLGTVFTLYKIVDNNVSVVKVSPSNAFVIINELTKKPEMGVIWDANKEDNKTYIWVYDALTVKLYEEKAGRFNLVEEGLHGFTEVPLVEWRNNSKRISNVERVIGQIDAYDRVISDSTTEQSNLRNAYLVLRDMGNIDDEFMKKLRNTGIFPTTGETADAKFVERNLNPEHTSLILSELEKSIYKNARIVNTEALLELSDARKNQIDMVYMSMDNDCDKTIKQWEQALEFEDRILKSFWTTLDLQPLPDYNTYDISYMFIKNKPRDNLADLESMARAQVILPKYKQYMMALGISEDEARKLAEEAEGEMNSLMPDFGDDEDDTTE